MAEVRGFRAYRFANGIVGSQEAVVTPPYDVISPEERAQLMRGSSYNMIHVLLPEPKAGKTAHEAAGERVASWLADGALRQDPESSFYFLEQAFTGQDGAEHVRRGFFGVVKLPEPGENIVLGHERTFADKIADRLKLTEACRANLGAVFCLYADPSNKLRPFLSQMDARPPDEEAHTIDGVTQRLWLAPDDLAVTEFFRDLKIYIADGHHRFATACAFRDKMRAEEKPDGLRSYDYVLVGFVPFNDPGLHIYPPHRVLDMPDDFHKESLLKGLEKWFEVESICCDLPSRVENGTGCTIGMSVHGGGDYVLTLRDGIDRAEMLGSDRGPAWRDLDVAVLHRGIIERLLGLPEGAELVYERDAGKALGLVSSGKKGLAFLLNATRPEQVKACAEANEPMPQKSTYFFPKLPSGLVIHRLV